MWPKCFDAFIRWFFRCSHIEEYRFFFFFFLFWHLCITKRGVQGHVTSSLQVKMVYYDWTQEETGYFLYKQLERNIF